MPPGRAASRLHLSPSKRAPAGFDCAHVESFPSLHVHDAGKDGPNGLPYPLATVHINIPLDHNNYSLEHNNKLIEPQNNATDPKHQAIWSLEAGEDEYKADDSVETSDDDDDESVEGLEASDEGESRTSAADRLASRGFSSDQLQSRVGELVGLTVFRNIAKPTQDAHNSMGRRFREYLALLNDPRYTGDEVLAHGAPHLPLNVVMGFLDYLVMSSQGQIGEMITVGTLLGKVGVWIGMMNRINGTAQTTEMTRALYRYAGGECALRYGLKREVRDKPIADGVDVALLLMQLWSPTDTLLNTRMRQQVATYITLAADLASRPGNIIESCAYKDSNEALSYQDLTFYILPPFNVERGQTIFAAPNMPTVSLAETPQLLVRVKFRYLKGKRADEDKFVEFALTCDPLATIGHCAVTNFIIFAMQDNVFQNISSWDELQHLMTIADKPLIISMKNSDTIRQLPVLRNYIPRTFNISPTKALSYNALYYQIQRVGRRAGFPDRLPLTCFRRKGANELDEAANVTVAQRTAIMGHDPLSRLFLRYQSRLLNLDLHGMAQGREPDLAPIRALGRMSLNADKAAPIAVSVEERRRIWTLPEVEALLEEQTKAKRACIAEHGSVGSAKGTPEGESYRFAYSAAKTAIARHERHSFAIERKQWFENQDTRLLASNPMPPTIDVEEPLSELPTPEQEADINNLDLLAVREKFGHIDYNAATGIDIADIFGNGALASVIDASIMMDHNTNPSTPFPNSGPTTSTLSAVSFYDPLIHYPPDIFQKLFAGGFDDSGSLSDRFSAWKQLAGLPSLKTIPKQHFTSQHYKGESPTDDMKCPIIDCGDDLTNKTASQTSIHIHSCTRRQKQKEADSRVDELYPQTERMATINEHQVHLQDAHLISASPGFVSFCYWCHEWWVILESTFSIAYSTNLRRTGTTTVRHISPLGIFLTNFLTSHRQVTRIRDTTRKPPLA
ncbi:hypothetical protein F5888DRAFT_1888207 [Russula emetica]|nr:hypothetical protein F5888DRAFT_1888207 [Russula emetica]